MTSPVSATVQDAVEVDDNIQLERNAGLIMGTNNSSIVSKRSVERLYLPEPHFYRYFVRKPQRRSPTINRGYWLRMRAIDWTVRRFLEKASKQPKMVINLGCGYDPLPFQWLTKERDLCVNTKFVDVDYEELMITKKEVIRNTPKLKSLLSPHSRSSEKGILLDSTEYAAIGCDLRNLPRLERLLRSVCSLDETLILCVAEVSMTYMHTDAANALIEWTATLSKDVTFCLLEQGSPDRPDHPFTSTMVKHFEKLGTPIHSLFEYPGQHSQITRFQGAGFTQCEVQNLWELWSDPRFLTIPQRLALDQVEPFDEWEDFALFASHYLLVTAHNRPSSTAFERPGRRDSIASMASDISARTASPFRQHEQWFALKHCDDQSENTKRHHGSAYQIPAQDAIAVHGGVGPKARLSTTAVCRGKDNLNEAPVVPPPYISARCCHTITTLANDQNILIGGRGSPTQPLKDCWLQTGSQWTRIHDLPEPRYRHRAMTVYLPDGHIGAVVFGGKTNASRVAPDTLLWDPRTGWQDLPLLNQTPLPRFGACFVRLGFNHGLLFGGMRQDGVICQGLWRWRLVIRDNRVAGISFRTSNALNASVGAYPWFSRLGASCALVRDELLIIGGVAKAGCIPKHFEILSIIGSFSAFNEFEREMQLKLQCVEPLSAPNCPRPFFIGHSTHCTKSGLVIFMGGGATCFSFGNYYSRGTWMLYEKEAGLRTDWDLIETQTTLDHQGAQNTRGTILPGLVHWDLSFVDVKTANPSSKSDFITLIQSSQPVVLKDLDIGTCRTKWTPNYLQSKVPPDRNVVFHSSPSRTMNFQRKDFNYKTLPFKSFTSALTSPSSNIYLRALSAINPTTTPANFEQDWPELACDVQLPSHLNSVLNDKTTKHSSCLRIANEITMWLHYDVMANVLFQIHGRKRLILFPPTDIKHLSFPPGSTTSTIDIFKHTSPSTLPATTINNFNTNDQKKNGIVGNDPTDIDTPHRKNSPSESELEPELQIPQGTSPHIVILNPGDALFIPPLWAHTGISLRHPNHDDKPSNGNINLDSNSAPSSEPRPDAALPRQANANNNNPYTNIALNVFFRSFTSQMYAAGRDVYGNRDLAAYEDARKDLERIVKRFELNHGRAKADSGRDEMNEYEGGILSSMPLDVRKAYLERLADELRKRAEEL